MFLDNIFNRIEQVDPDYGTIKSGGGNDRTPIQARPTTLEKLRNIGRNFLLKLNQRKLERKKEKFSNLKIPVDISGKIDPKQKEKIKQAALAVAKVEAKIKWTSKKDIPSIYVGSRAIKLVSKWKDACEYNASVGYLMLDEKAKKTIFDEDKPIEGMEQTDLINNENEKIDIEKTSAETQNQIEKEVNDAMNNNLNEDTISADDIRKMIDSSFNKEANEENPIEVSEEIENNNNYDDTVERAINNMETAFEEKNNEEIDIKDVEKETDEDVIDDKNIKEVIESEFNSQNSDEKIMPNEDNIVIDTVNDNEENNVNNIIDDSNDTIKVTQNESNNAKLNHFDEEGQPKNKVWVPLTDEQIEEFRHDLNQNFANDYRKNIGLDISETEENMESREEPIVAPSRENADSEKTNQESETVESYVYVDENEKEANNNENIEQKIAEANSIKDLEELRRKVEESHRRAKAAEERQRETKRMWESISQEKAKREEQERVLSENVNRLIAELEQRVEENNIYSDAVEEDCVVNENKANEAEEGRKEIDKRIADKEAEREALTALLETFTPQAENMSNKIGKR